MASTSTSSRSGVATYRPPTSQYQPPQIVRPQPIRPMPIRTNSRPNPNRPIQPNPRSNQQNSNYSGSLPTHLPPQSNVQSRPQQGMNSSRMQQNHGQGNHRALERRGSMGTDEAEYWGDEGLDELVMQMGSGPQARTSELVTSDRFELIISIVIQIISLNDVLKQSPTSLKSNTTTISSRKTYATLLPVATLESLRIRIARVSIKSLSDSNRSIYCVSGLSTHRKIELIVESVLYSRCVPFDLAIRSIQCGSKLLFRFSKFSSSSFLLALADKSSSI